MKCLEYTNLQRQRDSWLLKVGGRDDWGVTVNEPRAPFWGDKNVLELDNGEEYTTL